jgi:hypothetical protein
MISQTQKDLLKAVEELWNLYPDYRFGQMISNYCFLSRTGQIEDVYDCEDDELLRTIQHSIDVRRDAVSESLAVDSNVRAD